MLVFFLWFFKISSFWSNSHWGLSTTSIGNYSHSEGNLTTAVGVYSHSEGSQTTANDLGSHAEGYNTIASARYQHVQGVYNRTSSEESAFILGNGTGPNNRSNLIFAAGNQVQITGSLNVSGSITGSLFGTSSWAVNALTASYVPTLKASSASVASFVLSPLDYSTSITFTTAYPNNLYAVSVIGEDSRAWTISGKSPSGFTIDSNASIPLTNPVYWIATPFNP